MGLLDETLARIAPQEASARAAARQRLERLTMPHWALGRLMDLAEDLAGMTGSLRPPVARKVIVTMAGDHGVVAEGVSRFPQEVTPQMVHNFVRGGAGINALASLVGARVVVVDMGVREDLGELVRQGKILSRRVGPGTQNMARGPAMSREEALRAVEGGIEVALELGGSVDVFGTGEMGIGNTTPSSAVISVLTGADPARVTGRGTGIDDEGLQRKLKAVERALEVNAPDPGDPLDVLAKVGGFELGGIAGLVLGAASQRKPVLVDGLIAAAGALLAFGLAPPAREFMIASHCGAEPGHMVALEKLGKWPLLHLGLRLGEGTGAALAMHLVDAAVKVLTEVATFEEAAVSPAGA